MGIPSATIILILSVLIWTSVSAGILSPADQKSDLKGKPMRFAVMKPGSARSILSPNLPRSGESPQFLKLTTVRKAQRRELLNARLAKDTPDRQLVFMPMAIANEHKQTITARKTPAASTLSFPATAVTIVPTN